MGKREKIGAFVMVGIFVLLGIALYLTIERPTGPSRGIENNVLIEQRMKNISGN
jgi:uncharacterized membrane protein